MTYGIQWQRLVEEEKDLLTLFGIEIGSSFVRFTHELRWEEITMAFAQLMSLRERTPNLDESHVNFAVGDCLVEMERLFGKERTEQFMAEFLRLSASRDSVLQLAGGALIYLQRVEDVIKSVCACRELRLTVADFFSSDPNRRRVTLGQMKCALIKTEVFAPDFEINFNDFVQDRNRFVHSLWTEDTRANPFIGLPPEEHFVRVADSINQLVRRANRVERVFRGWLAAIRESVTEELHPNTEDASAVNPWLKYIPEFRDVLRNNEREQGQL